MQTGLSNENGDDCMAKLAQAFAKYLVKAKLSASGIVERPDIIGAIFGQTEGLLGNDMDLRDLQRTGRIGRIDVSIKTNDGKSYANIIIPSSMDSSETSLIAASLETIDKVGPCEAKILIESVEDIRSQKRYYVIERAKEILKNMIDDSIPDSQKMSESIKQAVRSWEIIDYKGLSCGQGIYESDEIIVVEGRADVINLLKNGIRNAIAIEGSNIPDSIIELTKQKVATAFIDSDRGGDLDLKKLLSVAEIDYVARPEEGKEVEELTKKEIYKALRERSPVDQVIVKHPQDAGKKEIEIDEKSLKTFSSLLDDLIGTRAAYFIDKRFHILSKLPLSELGNIITDFSDIYAVVFDGKITQNIADMALQRKISCIVGMDSEDDIKAGNIKLLAAKDLK